MSNDFFEQYRKLTASQLRDRLAEIEAEGKALRVLLRSKAALERQQKRRHGQAEGGQR